MGNRTGSEEVYSDILNNSSVTTYMFDNDLDTADMPALESEESAAPKKNQTGQGLKILTPNQMLSRLLITLAQLKTGNNSQKLKNEIGQLLYSLYC